MIQTLTVLDDTVIHETVAIYGETLFRVGQDPITGEKTLLRLGSVNHVLETGDTRADAVWAAAVRLVQRGKLYDLAKPAITLVWPAQRWRISL